MAQRLAGQRPREQQERLRRAAPVQPVTARLAAARLVHRAGVGRRAGKSVPAFALEVVRAQALSKAQQRAAAPEAQPRAAALQVSKARQQEQLPAALRPAVELQPAERLTAQILPEAAEVVAVAQPFSAPAVARIFEVAAAVEVVAGPDVAAAEAAALPSAAAEWPQAVAEAEVARPVPAAEALRQVAAAEQDAVAAGAARQGVAEAGVPPPAGAAERDAGAVLPPAEGVLARQPEARPSAAVSAPASSAPEGPWRRPQAQAPERQ